MSISGVTILEPSKLQSKRLAKSNTYLALRVLMEVKTELKLEIMRRFGKNLVRSGIMCPCCGVSEIYRSMHNTDLRSAYWMITAKVPKKKGKAFCRNCEEYFDN